MQPQSSTWLSSEGQQSNPLEQCGQAEGQERRQRITARMARPEGRQEKGDWDGWNDDEMRVQCFRTEKENSDKGDSHRTQIFISWAGSGSLWEGPGKAVWATGVHLLLLG